MLPEDLEAGCSHEDNYVCSAADYREHMAEVFALWQERPEVKRGEWPLTLEECWGMQPRVSYPLSKEDAHLLADIFIREYAPSRSEKNRLDQFEGFIYEGPEYLTMFAGDGKELQTIRFPVGRQDDGLIWGDYAMPRIEPCNRVDRFLSGVAYLDGERPYLIVCRGYYTRTTVVAYDFLKTGSGKRSLWTVGMCPWQILLMTEESICWKGRIRNMEVWRGRGTTAFPRRMWTATDAWRSYTARP